MSGFSPQIDSRRELAAVALGQAAADLAVVGGEVLNVYTGEVRCADVLVKNGLIAAVGDAPAGSLSGETGIIEAKGKVLIPGLIDGHIHVDNYVFSELAPWSLRGATTTIITETTGPPFPLGYPGLVALLDSARGQPMRIYATVTPMTTANPLAAEHALTPEQVATLLTRHEVVGLGESYWNPIFGGDARIMECFEATRRTGKRIEGHSAGAKTHRLQSYVSLGVTSCHEPITPEEVIERLRLGLFVFLRNGETRQDLSVLAGLKDMLRDFQNVGLASDGLGPRHLVRRGHMDELVRQSIRLGFDPVTAIQMASYNVARYFRLDHIIGGIAPGRAADIVVIPSLSDVRAETVLCGGQVVVSGGEFTGRTRRHEFPDFVMNSLGRLPTQKAADFSVVSMGDRVSVRALEVDADAIKREALIDLIVQDGEIQIDLTRDVLKLAAIDRAHQLGQIFNGFIRGFGLQRGAIATSDAADSWAIVVIGADAEDMAIAVNRLRELHGGTVIVAGGRVLAELSLPVGGIITEAPLVDTASRLDELQQVYDTLGGTLPEVRVPLTFLSTEAIPFFTVSEHGLIDMKRQLVVPVLIQPEYD
jgi:adenine deaminase